ncbi:MAG TPA: hypothetical protein VN420_02825 [Candidatus Fimivivens sp.]|nr:hypothetical protein [Candidatus Fimivivens sp.]
MGGSTLSADNYRTSLTRFVFTILETEEPQNVIAVGRDGNRLILVTQDSREYMSILVCDADTFSLSLTNKMILTPNSYRILIDDSEPTIDVSITLNFSAEGYSGTHSTKNCAFRMYQPPHSGTGEIGQESAAGYRVVATRFDPFPFVVFRHDIGDEYFVMTMTPKPEPAEA